MGMSHVAAASILFAGLVTAGQTALRTGFDTQELLQESWKAKSDWVEDAKMTDMTFSSVANQGQNSRIRVDNTGDTTIDGSKISVLINGVDKTSSIVTRKVATRTTDVWAPGQQIEIIVPPSGATRVVIIDQHGIMEVYP